MIVNRHAVHVVEQAVAQVTAVRAARRLEAALEALCSALTVEAPPHAQSPKGLENSPNPSPRPLPVVRPRGQMIGEWDKGALLPAALDRALFLRGLSLPREALTATVYREGECLYAVCSTKPRTAPVVYEAIPCTTRCGAFAVITYRWVQAVMLVPRPIPLPQPPRPTPSALRVA